MTETCSQADGTSPRRCLLVGRPGPRGQDFILWPPVDLDPLDGQLCGLSRHLVAVTQLRPVSVLGHADANTLVVAICPTQAALLVRVGEHVAFTLVPAGLPDHGGFLSQCLRVVCLEADPGSHPAEMNIERALLQSVRNMLSGKPSTLTMQLAPYDVDLQALLAEWSRSSGDGHLAQRCSALWARNELHAPVLPLNAHPLLYFARSEAALPGSLGDERSAERKRLLEQLEAIPYGDLARGFAGLPWAELATQPDATLASVLTAPPADDGHPFYRQGAGADEQPTAPSPLPPGLVVDWTHVSDVELARAMDGQSDGGEARAAVAADTFADIASLEAMALSARDEGHTSTGQAASDGRRQCSARDLAGLTRLGSAEIASGRVAVVLLAGGQGTRLGHRGPKGTFSPAGLPSGKCIFRRHAERLLAASNRAQVVAQSAAQPSGPLSRHCRWVVLTSAETHHDTEAYFEAEDFFGLDRALVRFLTQASLPAVHLLDGTFILAEPYRLSTAPNGNGGLYEALARSGTLDWLEAGGVRHLQICGVDNLLTRAPCPGLVGMALAGGLRVASKAVPRVRPTEAVGVFAERHGRFGVVEYTELGADLAGAVADPATGRLAFDLANIGHQYMRLDVVRHLARLGAFHMLPFHKAQKRIAGLARAEAAGHRAASLCGLKLELFIFDTLPLVGTVTAGRAGVQLVRREAEFAPVKNADGPGAVDCPATAAGLLLDQCTAWLRDSGVQVDGSLRAEVAPRVSVAGEGLGAFAGLRLSVEPGRDAVFIDSREGLASLLQ